MIWSPLYQGALLHLRNFIRTISFTQCNKCICHPASGDWRYGDIWSFSLQNVGPDFSLISISVGQVMTGVFFAWRVPTGSFFLWCKIGFFGGIGIRVRYGLRRWVHPNLQYRPQKGPLGSKRIFTRGIMVPISSNFPETFGIGGWHARHKMTYCKLLSSVMTLKWRQFPCIVYIIIIIYIIS